MTIISLMTYCRYNFYILINTTLMIRDHRTDIQLKKQAFRTSIRREWLQKHFSKIRNSIQESEHFENLALEKVRETVKELPASSISLVELMTEYNSIVTSVVVDEIVIVSEKMVRLQAVEWSHYVYILNRVIEGSFSKKDLEKVIAHTLLSVYECADVLVNRNKDNKYLYESIMRDCLDYFYRSSLFILNLDQMEQNILTAIAIRLWKYQRTPDQYEKLVFGCNRILTNSYDSQQVENISPQQKEEQQMMRIVFINQVFYSNNAEIITFLISQCLQLSIVSQNEELHINTLQLLINITRYMDRPSYYYPLLSAQVLHIINANIISHKQDRDIIIYTLRLLNNMLVNDFILSQAILKEIHLNQLIQVFHANQHEVRIQTELVELFINIIHFLNDDHQIIRILINYDVHVMILELLSKNEDIEDAFLSQAFMALFVAINVHPMAVQSAIRRYRNTLRKIVDDFSGNQIAEELLKFIYEQEESSI